MLLISLQGNQLVSLWPLFLLKFHVPCTSLVHFKTLEVSYCLPPAEGLAAHLADLSHTGSERNVREWLGLEKA